VSGVARISEPTRTTRTTSKDEVREEGLLAAISILRQPHVLELLVRVVAGWGHVVLH
jgi:hypothetical protein